MSAPMLMFMTPKARATIISRVDAGNGTAADAKLLLSERAFLQAQNDALGKAIDAHKLHARSLTAMIESQVEAGNVCNAAMEGLAMELADARRRLREGEDES